MAADYQQNYMYGSTVQPNEESRLATLNQTHTPETVRLLEPVLDSLPEDASILEIGCGEGSLAAEVAKHLKPGQKLLATDAEPDQVSKTNLKLEPYAHASALCINFIDNYEQLKSLGPFDCIYCRWVICHIAVELQQQVLAKLLQLLKPGGWFVMDDCDNRVVEWRFKPDAHINEKSQQLIEAIQPMFVNFYSVIAKDRHLNLQRDAKDIQRLLQAAANANHIEGEVSLLGEYQVILQSEQDKAAITQGKISTQQVYEKLSGQSAQIFIETHLQAQQDENLACAFLGEAVVAFKQSA